MPDGVPVKGPGYINAWAKQYSWQERAVARDQIFNRLAIVGPLKERAAAGKRTVETANRLHDIIESELEVLEDMIDRRWKFGGTPVDKSAKLANLAAALKDTAAAGLIALEKAESDYE